MNRYQIARMNKFQLARRAMLETLFENVMKSKAWIKKTGFWKFIRWEWVRTSKNRLAWYFTISASMLVGTIVWTPAVVKKSEVPKIEISEVQLKQMNKLASEYAYFEGQRDALEGDIRVAKKDSAWIWVKSPWDQDTSMENIVYYPELGQAGSVDALMKRIKK